MSNSILGAGIIGQSPYIEFAVIALSSRSQTRVPPGLPFAVTEAGFWTGIILLVILCGVTDW